MLTKELPIQQAREWESYGDKEITNSKDFKAELHKYGVNDLFDKQLTIKQDKEKYIFAINGANNFAVNSKVNFTTFIHDFYKDLAETEKRAEQKKAVISVSEFEKNTKIEITITENAKDLAELKDQIKKNETLEEKTTDVENVKYKIERLITFFEQEKKLTNQNIWSIFGRPYDRKDTGLFKINKTEIERRITQLKDMQKGIKRLERNTDKTNKETKMDDVNEMNMNITLKQFSDRIEELGKEAPNFILARNDVILGKWDTVPYFEIKGYSAGEVKKFNKVLWKINKEYAILDELKLTGAKRQEVSQDLQDLEEYLNKVINNPDTFKPSEHPFIPTHTKDFFELMNIKPTPEEYQKLNKEADKTEKIVWAGILATNISSKESSNTAMIDPGLTGYQEAVEKYGIKWALYHTFDFFPNMKTEQKSFWTNALFLGGMWFALFKLGKWFFTWAKNEKWEKVWPWLLWRLGILAGIGLWSNMLTGKSPLEFIDKAVNGWFKFKDMKVDFFKKSSEASSDAKEAVVNPLTTTLLFGNKKISELPTIMDNKTLKLNNYDELLKNTEGENKKLLERIGREDKNEVIRQWLAQLWITPESIGDLDQNMTIDEYYVIYCQNIKTRNDYCLRNKLEVVDGKGSEEKKLLTSSKKISDSDLDTINANWVYESIQATTDSEEGKQAKTLLDIEVDGLSGLITDKTILKREMRTFYDKMPKNDIGKKEVKIIQSQGILYLETYSWTTEINIDKKTMKWFTDNTGKEYVFSSYSNLLVAANLTNYIKKICKDKETNTTTPFHISTIWNDIEFTNPSRFKINTEIISAGIGWSLKDISPTLEKHKQAYCDYLNNTTPKFWKEKPAT